MRAPFRFGAGALRRLSQSEDGLLALREPIAGR